MTVVSYSPNTTRRNGWTNFIPITREIADKAQLMAMKPDDLNAKLSEIVDRYMDLDDWFNVHRHRHLPETTFVIEYESGDVK